MGVCCQHSVSLCGVPARKLVEAPQNTFTTETAPTTVEYRKIRHIRRSSYPRFSVFYLFPPRHHDGVPDDRCSGAVASLRPDTR